VDYFKILDKETGETYESKIDSIKQTPTGVEIKTEDGKTHKLDFFAENGIPKIKYNDGPSETLLSAQGKNGSFYYDPDKGLWYAENGHLIPLLDAFRQQGITTQVNPDNTVSSKSGDNLLNVNIGEGQGTSPFNLPSLPENVTLRTIFILALLFCIGEGCFWQRPSCIFSIKPCLYTCDRKISWLYTIQRHSQSGA